MSRMKLASAWHSISKLVCMPYALLVTHSRHDFIMDIYYFDFLPFWYPVQNSRNSLTFNCNLSSQITPVVTGYLANQSFSETFRRISQLKPAIYTFWHEKRLYYKFSLRYSHNTHSQGGMNVIIKRKKDMCQEWFRSVYSVTPLIT